MPTNLGGKIMRRLAVAVGIAVSASIWPTLAFPSDYYKVQVTRKNQDLYEVVGQSIYVMTRYCYEYVYYSEAILKIDAPAGYTVGEIIFVGNGSSKCDVAKVLR
ncbi:hypothetical protein [Bradyrhizobium sp. AC87j1]|uniref:hypothetical protein n=1 Tax=Bradyrhizobium sp. AC87j1 TaxID=2055894 RepID=UPI0011B03505|nr:hypothetical protein [Bradyrhizobium sp. AC87j1]